jgi:hypothetical protein
MEAKSSAQIDDPIYAAIYFQISFLMCLEKMH